MHLSVTLSVRKIKALPLRETSCLQCNLLTFQPNLALGEYSVMTVMHALLVSEYIPLNIYWRSFKRMQR